MNIRELTTLMNQFVDQKGWYEEDSPHPQTPRNLAVSLSLESAEVLELYEWGTPIPGKEKLADELADVALYLLQLASVQDIDLEGAILRKLEENKQRSWQPEEDRDIQDEGEHSHER